MSGHVRLIRYVGEDRVVKMDFRVDVLGANSVLETVEDHITSLERSKRLANRCCELTGFELIRMEERTVLSNKLVEWDDE